MRKYNYQRIDLLSVRILLFWEVYGLQRDYRHFFCEPSEAQREYLLYVASVGVYGCDKSFYEDSYYHEGYYFLCVTDGRGFIGIEDRLYPVETGHLALIDLQKAYQFYPDPVQPWTFAWIRWDGRNADWLYRRICDQANLFHTDEPAAFAQTVEKLLGCCEAQAAGYELHAAALLMQILADLYTVSRDFRSTYITPRDYPNAVKLVTNYIEINYFRKLTLQELASVAFVSPYHLLREFKKHTGFTPLVYTNLYRLSLAKQMLTASDLTIEQIALNTGYCSHSYFSKCFREDTGITPEKFRAQHKRNLG